MPCSDGRDVRVIYTKGADPYYQEECKRLKKRNDELADLLCQAGRARYRKTNIPEAVLKWWDSHCQWDKSRGEPW
jgi:hypothetical protein